MSSVCLHQVIITDENMGEKVCQSCGVVISEKNIDITHPLEAIHNADEFSDIRHSGPPTTARIYDGGLPTVMNTQNVDSGFHSISSKNKYMFNRLRILDRRSKSKKSISLTKALLILDSMKSDLGIPDYIAEQSARLYRKAISMGLSRGKQLKALMLSCIYIVCRLNGVPRSLLDVTEKGNINKKLLTRTIRDVIKDMKIDLNEYDVSLFINRVVNNMELGERVKRAALELLDKAKKNMINSGKQPLAQASACIYLACLLNGKKITQRKVATACDVSEVTLRNRVKTLRVGLGINN